MNIIRGMNITSGDGSQSPRDYAQRMRELKLSVSELLAAAQRVRKGKLDTGRVAKVFKAPWENRCC